MGEPMCEQQRCFLLLSTPVIISRIVTESLLDLKEDRLPLCRSGITRVAVVSLTQHPDTACNYPSEVIIEAVGVNDTDAVTTTRDEAPHIARPTTNLPEGTKNHDAPLQVERAKRVTGGGS